MLAERKQVLEQSWFTGVHSNVGGGYQDPGLSDIALHWMAARAESCGLYLEPGWRQKLKPDPTGELRDSRNFFYRLMGSAERPIGGQKNGFEKAHNGAMDRMVRMPAYAPANLVAYRDSAGFSIDTSEPGWEGARRDS
jgi:hypothetical protein